MTFGIHSDTVSEVVEFATKSGLLRSPVTANCRYHIIPSLDVDLDIYREPDQPEAAIQGSMNWVDIKRLDESRVAGAMELDEELFSTYDKLTIRIYEDVAKQLKGKIPEYEIEQIAEDLCAIAFQRMANGVVENTIYETLFQIYKEQGYPCGWNGEYPNGQFVVYSSRE